MSIGRSKAKVYVETDTKTTFNEVAGEDEAKAADAKPLPKDEKDKAHS